MKLFRRAAATALTALAASASAQKNLDFFLLIGKSNMAGQPGFGFSMAMHRRLPKTEFGLVVNAKGGSALAEWAKGSAYYNGAAARTRFAMRSGTLKGILWHQGEAGSAVHRGEVGALGHEYTGFNALIPTLVTRRQHTAVVRTDSLKHKGDETHFDRASTIKLGERFADAVWKVVYGSGNPTGIQGVERRQGAGRLAPRPASGYFDILVRREPGLKFYLR